MWHDEMITMKTQEGKSGKFYTNVCEENSILLINICIRRRKQWENDDDDDNKQYVEKKYRKEKHDDILIVWLSYVWKPSVMYFVI